MGNDSPLTEKPFPYPILFFDGDCVLCNRAAQLLIQATLGSELRFASLQGKVGSELLGNLSSESKSLIYWEQNEVYFQKQAIVKALSHATVTGWYPIGLIIKALPESAVNKLYQIVAQNRYNWFGKTECWLVGDRFLG